MGVESCTCEDTNHVTFRVPAAEFARFASPLRSRQVTSHHIADTAAIEGTLPSHPPLYLLIPPAQQTNAPDAPTSFWASFPPPPAPPSPLCARRPPEPASARDGTFHPSLQQARLPPAKRITGLRRTRPHSFTTRAIPIAY